MAESDEKVPLRCRWFGHRWEGVWLFTPNVIVQECARCGVRRGDPEPMTLDLRLPPGQAKP